MAKTEYIHYILEIYTFIRINPFKSYIKNIEKYWKTTQYSGLEDNALEFAIDTSDFKPYL